ncbi:SemiSWEET transporter [Clostridium lacusfryxellense]|uniref:SemiSWEET transporter n=1 Tax=Clostridium lacusfryxellense TaxID=205328 RepID=UPI001C0B0195|nr:SemiSWEET transporter [Clostridium lacusfryxellense]MBU3113321.1 SemiSWEET transporter [Clostridium lacusfryxellense]
METTLSFIAAILTTISFVPQALKVIKTKNTKGISFGMYLMLTVGVFLWSIYGIMTKQTAIVFANVVTLVLALIILKYTYEDIKKQQKLESLAKPVVDSI